MVLVTHVDQVTLALCAWKEARNGGQAGMQSVMNVILNRAKVNNKSIYAIVYAPLQFSSMSYPHDPQLLLQAEETDTAWLLAQALAGKASTNTLEDITGGARWYYALTIPEPSWAKSLIETVVIDNQRFMK
jgi:spore germination cell wall hydrolase CwlJ-like protein